MKKRAALFLILFFALVVLFTWEEDVWTQSLKKIYSISSLIQENYFKEIDNEELVNSSIKGMLQTLDPHSYFLDPKNFSTMKEEYKGKYCGLGIMIQKQEDRIVVITPIEGTPAYRLGIQAGDFITHINGESTKPISSFEAMQKLRGLKGTEVNITIVRVGLDKPLDLTIIREEIPLHSVPYAFMIKGDIGYISIRNFAETTTREFEEKMGFLKKQGMKQLILDLRLNGGGTLAQSIELSDEFLPRGSLIVSIKGRKRYYNSTFYARRDNQYEDIPLVILINEGTASAPEIVSGAVKDNDRGLIVGENSWGKGLVQTLFPLSPNSAIALSTAKYFTPSGRSIQRDYSNIEDYLLFKNNVPDEKREVTYTAKGRKVLGQGGISPDYKVEFTYKLLTSKLLFKGAYFSYVRKLVNKKTPLAKRLIFPGEQALLINDSSIKKIVTRNFNIDSEVLEDFKFYLKENNISYDSDEFENAQTEIKRELKREIFTFLWGIDEGMKVFRKSDPWILKAIECMPEAETLVADKGM